MLHQKNYTAGAGKNAKIELQVGDGKSVVELPNSEVSSAILHFDPPKKAKSVEIRILSVHSENNNGFETIRVWTHGYLKSILVKGSL